MTAHTIAELAAMAAATDDQTVTTSGGDYEYTPPPEGVTIGRFIEYIETGKHKQKPYQGKPKPDAEEVRLTFELLHPKKNIKEIELEGGEKKTVADTISIRLTKKSGEKARFKKYFVKMQYGRQDKVHLAQMLGEPFIITVVHNKSDDGKKTYANIEKDGEVLIQAPFVIDPLTEEKKAVPVPANIKPLRVFLWDHATKETWDTLYIDGTRTEKDDKGVEKEVSKNWLQERIQSAINYPGSKLNLLLADLVDLPATEAEAVATTSKAELALQELEASAGPTSATSDDLASLGLT